MKNITSRYSTLLLAGVLMAGGLTGCASDKAGAEKDALVKENADLKAQRDKAIAEANAAKADRDRLERLRAAQPPAQHQATGLENTPGVTQNQNAQGEEQIELEGDVLFDTAKATIKPGFKKTLDKVAEVMKTSYAGRRFRIEGHTDPRPVHVSGWDDNWDLGSARARAVALYLISKGVAKQDLYIASFADNELKSTTDFSVDRRVDIVVVR